MGKRQPFALRSARFQARRPKTFGWVIGLVSGLLFGAAMGVAIGVLLPALGIGPPESTGSTTEALVLGLVSGALFGAATGLTYVYLLRKVLLPPPRETEVGLVSQTQLREAGRLVRRGEASADPTIARLAVWQARQGLRFRRPHRSLAWVTSPVSQGVLSVVMTLVWGWLLVDSLLRTGETAQTLFWGFATLLGLAMLGNSFWLSRYYRRVHRALEANTAVVEAHEAENADKEEPGAG